MPWKLIKEHQLEKNVTFVNDMSSGTTYGDGFKNGARSMYISTSSGVKWISRRDIPLVETGFTNSLRLCLGNTESVNFHVVDKEASISDPQ